MRGVWNHHMHQAAQQDVYRHCESFHLLAQQDVYRHQVFARLGVDPGLHHHARQDVYRNHAFARSGVDCCLMKKVYCH